MYSEMEPESSCPKSPAGDEMQLLPPAVSSFGNTDVTQIQMDGEAVALDYLGPMIVNKDGTLRRISNWNTLSKAERDNTLRIVTKRNRERIEKLKGAKEQENLNF